MSRVRDLYGYTCPEIDDGINNLNNIIDEVIENVLCDIFSIDVYSNKEISALITTYSDEAKGKSKDIFEAVRDTNSKLRQSAEEIIEDLEDDITNKDNEISYLKDEIYQLT